MRYELLNGSNLAYLGDAYYELQIRNYLLSKNITKTKDLREVSIEFVSAKSQAFIMNQLLSNLNEEEMKIYLRGRNAVHMIHRKNVDPKEYLIASGFEALIGYLYLKNDEKRLDEIIKSAIDIVEANNDNLWEKYRSRSN